MKTLADVLAKFPPQILERYDFSNAKYHGSLTPMTGIVCREHGEFSQYVGQLRKDGAGCQACGQAVRVTKRRSAPDKVLEQARAVHGDKYTYERTVYTNSATHMIVTCPEHGDFKTAPNNFLRGKGCPACGHLRKGVNASGVKSAQTSIAKHAARFVEEARKIHGDDYDYSQTIYRGKRQKLTIRCKKHGEFTQTAGPHLSRGQGCPSCSNHKSRGEAEILKFVSIFAEAQSRDRVILAPKELDVYLPQHNLAIEYCGEYWHGAKNPSEEAVSRTRHSNKTRDCAAKGIRLLTIFESEWKTRPEAIKRLLRNAMGKTRGKLMARKCELRIVGSSEANAFFEAYHPQGGNGYGEHYGLYWGSKLVACMRFTFGANDRGVHSQRAWTLSRYATRVAVTGGASRLLAAFRAEHPAEDVKSFSDNRYFSGEMYKTLGFELEEESPPDYQVFHAKTGLLPKAAWQRRKIPARIRDIGAEDSFDPEKDPRSERDMTYLLNAVRVYDCGKKRWVLRA